MNREIKFRYWDTFNAAMVVMDNGLASFFASYEKTFDGENSPVLMQFTGLKDKNGVQIYEGDILATTFRSDGDRHKLPVQWLDSTSCFGLQINERTTTHIRPDIYEVAGNIYENPELLEKENLDVKEPAAA